ncbi:hypothetical protein [Desulfobulbus alkaliphilus]|uniref:hypothetical protein n=1 Tax=Desulfobulbus alkaliphilus TaxID=869814 RepID=UPI0019623937|nr:hypothetical protein [Desulfobulbus alkaliphilus]MBM9537956.1 hypothetical protein [Desulfobulbus alkaliphilus]
MMTLTKKCPHCGSKRFTSRSETSRTTPLSFATIFSCQECCQQFRYLFPFALAFESRVTPPSELPVNFLLRIQGTRNQYARITNISPGGLSFIHHVNVLPADTRLLVVDLYNCNDGSSLESLRIEIVASSEQELNRQGRKASIFRYSARFIHLNQAQQKVLVTCISQHGSPRLLSPQKVKYR